MPITSKDQLIAGMQPPISFYKYQPTGGSYNCATGLVCQGFPASWTPTTTAIAGVTVDGTQQATQLMGGFFPYTNPPSGASSYLAALAVCTPVAFGLFAFIQDMLWYSTGVSATIKTAQTINSVPLPPRDSYGTSNGAGVIVGILVLTGTLAATGATINYTNSAGVSGRTASPMYATSYTAGSFFDFTPALGDVGVQSIQSITFPNAGTSCTIALLMYRQVTCVQMGSNDWGQCGFPQLYNGSALYLAVAYGVAMSVAGTLTYAQG